MTMCIKVFPLVQRVVNLDNFLNGGMKLKTKGILL